MGEMPRNWEEELLARGRQQGERQGEERGRLACRKALRQWLEQRFAPLPEGLIQRIEAADLAALVAAPDRVPTIHNLDELGL
jgi:hypothetical protein